MLDAKYFFGCKPLISLNKKTLKCCKIVAIRPQSKIATILQQNTGKSSQKVRLL